MPRRKPDEIIEHRIALGPWERERLDLVVAGNVFNRVANPVVNLLSDVSGLAALVGILEAVGVLNIRDYIKDNTPLDEWANSVAAGLFSGFDEAMTTLDTAYDETIVLLREAGELGEEIIEKIPTQEEIEELIPTGREIGEGAARLFGEAVIGFAIGTAKGAIDIPAKPLLRIWAWGKTTVQNAPRTPDWVPGQDIDWRSVR